MSLGQLVFKESDLILESFSVTFSVLIQSDRLVISKESVALLIEVVDLLL